MDKTFNPVTQIEQDIFGYMWFTATEGIYKYDGNDYRLIDYKEIFGPDFMNDSPCAIKKDNYQNLWFYTSNGELTKLGTNGQYKSFKENISNNRNNEITSISISKDKVWFGSKSGTLYRFNNKTEQLDSIITIPKTKDSPTAINDLTSVDGETVFLFDSNLKILRYELRKNVLTEENGIITRPNQQISLTSDSKRRLWVASELEGLLCYDIDSKIILKRFGKLQNSKNSIKYAQFKSVYCDENDNVWAGTGGYGLYLIKDFNFQIYKHYENNILSISNNTVLSITEDNYNNIWIVTKKGEINQLIKNNNHIGFYSGLENNMPLTSDVLSILKSRDGSLWIGTDGRGLNRITPDGKTIQYNMYQSPPYYFEGKYIHKIIEDAIGNIWIATYQNGLWLYNVSTDTFKKIELLDDYGMPVSDIRFLFKDSKNRIWASVLNAFVLFSEEQQLIAHLKYNEYGLFGQVSESISEDENGTIWTGILEGGLYYFKENQNNFINSYFIKRNYHLKEDNDDLNYNIKMITPDKHGVLWITCTSGMLIRYDINSNRFESFLKKDLFNGIHFQTVLVQNPNSLWLSSKIGIYHYNISTNNMKTYFRSDGLINNYFVNKSAYYDNDGKFYFGGDYGVSIFDPSEINKVDVSPKLYINAIDILNKPGNTIVPDQFHNFVENITSLDLKYDQSSIEFEFSAIDDLLYGNYQYAYRLIGFDKDWILSKDQHTATYTNIPYGNYTFEVKAGGKSGNWDIEPKAIAINISPPFWKSNSAYVIYFILTLLIVYATYSWLHLKTRLAKKAWQNSKEKEVYDLKMDFFAKMSHEIQTPLTLILGPIEDMLNRAGESGNTLLKKRLHMIGNNANRLSRIATELMSLRNKELGKLRVFVSENDLIKDLKRIAISFSEQARFKNIDFVQRYPKEDLTIWYDTEKIEHVIYNLLSNAFKFTPRDGIIKLEIILNDKDEQVEIAVTDSGPGIPEEELNDIFKLFYQTNAGRQNKGSGIGLALTKELVDLHHGTIKVSSSTEFGTSFKVYLPKNEFVFSEEEKVEIENSSVYLDDIDSFPNYDQIKEINSINLPSEQKTYTLLIVEDNVEMQIFLGDVLSKSYNLIMANNGQEGIGYAEKLIPDLIISDIMMPIMDGYEMSKIIQNKKNISHIPIIFLTAENTTRSKIKGLELGAIEYLKKPFNFNELLLKINNILISKEKVLSKYKIDVISAPKDLPDQTKDAVFIEKLVKEINDEIENVDFKLEELSNSLNMSYSVIFKRCLEITGKTLVEFSRSIRLHKAALLIAQNEYNISESAYMVGYKDSKYFTKCFKEEFGVPPATFKRETKAIGLEKTLNKYKIKF